MKIYEIINEENLGTASKRPARTGGRPERDHDPVKRYKEEPKNEELE